MFKNYSIDLGSCKNKINNESQPGGVCSIFRDKAASTTRTYSKDDLGRWIVTEKKINNSSTLFIVNFYRPAKSGKGPNTFERQHINALHDKGRKCDNPREIFIEDLKKLVDEIKTKTDKILLAGDLNEHVK